MKRKQELIMALKAIAQGYPIRVELDTYIVVKNPDFREDDGSAPNLVIDTGVLDWINE